VRFTCYWWMICIFAEMDCFHSEYSPGDSQAYFVWTFLAPESQFQVDSSSFGWWPKIWKILALNGVPGVPRVKIETSACECIYSRWNMDSLRQSAILHVSGCVYCEANSYAIVDRSEKGDDLDLFLSFWNRKLGSSTITRSI
jgi:hypothetical protein